MLTRMVSVTLPAEELDWGVAERVVRSLYPTQRLGQFSRTAAWPDCTDDCVPDGECGHGWAMRYSVTVGVAS